MWTVWAGSCRFYDPVKCHNIVSTLVQDILNEAIQVRFINLIPMQFFHVITYPLLFLSFTCKSNQSQEPYKER